MDTTPLHYAQMGGITGIRFQIGETICFAPCEDERLFVVSDAALQITAMVPSLFSTHLITTVIEPRLQRLGVA